MVDHLFLRDSPLHALYSVTVIHSNYTSVLAVHNRKYAV